MRGHDENSGSRSIEAMGKAELLISRFLTHLDERSLAVPHSSGHAGQEMRLVNDHQIVIAIQLLARKGDLRFINHPAMQLECAIADSLIAHT